MADSQSDNKREQVARVYEGMTDRELEDLAEDAWSLTDIGKNALKGELAKRNLHVDLNELRPQHEQTSRLVVLRRFTDYPKLNLPRAFSNQRESSAPCATTTPLERIGDGQMLLAASNCASIPKIWIPQPRYWGRRFPINSMSRGLGNTHSLDVRIVSH
jgi:hypothetical protein